MTPQVMKFISACVAKYAAVQGDVLEIGAFNVNGTPRPIFADRARFPSYLGVDMRQGKDVDQIANAQSLPFESERFGVVVCAEMLEHDDRFWVSMQEMARVVKPLGHVIITTCGIGFPRHDYPSDYWRFTADGLATLCRSVSLDVITASEDTKAHGTYALAQRPKLGIEPVRPQ